jgi:hypothetical protein
VAFTLHPAPASLPRGSQAPGHQGWSQFAGRIPEGAKSAGGRPLSPGLASPARKAVAQQPDRNGHCVCLGQWLALTVDLDDSRLEAPGHDHQADPRHHSGEPAQILAAHFGRRCVDFVA